MISALVVALLVSLPSPGNALPRQADAGCGADRSLLLCVVNEAPQPKPTVVRTEQPGGSSTSARIPASPIVWSRDFIPSQPIGEPPCQRTSVTATEITITYGAVWLVQVTNTDTGELLAIYTYCEWPGDDPPQPPPLPEPPSETDIDTQEILSLAIGLSPPVDGIGGVAQLETWFWCDDPGIVDVEARTSGSIAAAEVGISELVWTITGPSGTDIRTASSCGEEPDPDGDGEGAAATWTPTQTGDHMITLGATWEGTWTARLYLDRAGWLTVGPFPLSPLSIAGEPLTYPVVEIQTVGGRP